MSNREEERLNELKTKINEREYPERAIDEAIRMGIQKASRLKKPSYLWKTSLAASLIFLVLFISSLRVSEAFASYVSTIPGMEQIVEMVRQDKGMVSVIDNDFVQTVNNSAAHQGITITLSSFIADQEQLVLFYKVDSSSSSFENLRIDKIQVVDEYGEEVAFDSLSIDAIDSKEEDMYQSDYGLKEVLNKEKYIMNIELSNGDEPLADTWEIPFKVNQNKVGKTKDIPLNQEFLVEGQKILVKTIKASPTRVGIQMEFSTENTMRIFDIEDLRLVDENGETWSRISNGLSSSGDFKEKTYYLQSNYFEKPRELYLVFSKIRALEKDKLEVKVDTEELKILLAPDERLAKVEYEENYDETGALLLSWDERFEQANHMSPIQSYTGADGEVQKLHSQYHDGGGVDGMPRFGFPYDRRQGSGVITFELQDYPSWIEGDVRIPLEQY